MATIAPADSKIGQQIMRIMDAKNALANYLKDNTDLATENMSINELVEAILALIGQKGAYNIVQNLLEDGNSELVITDAGGSSTNNLDVFITREISGAYTNSRVTKIGVYAFESCQKLTKINFPQVTNVGRYAFRNCIKLSSVSLPKVKRIEDSAFYSTAIVGGVFPEATYIGFNAFNTGTLTKLDFSKLSSIGQFAFNGATQLDTLILRNSTVCSLANATDTFTNTKIAAGTGYIYVPDNLVDSYKTATNWVTFANQIKPISELEGAT